MPDNIFVWDGISEVPKDVTNVRIKEGVTSIGEDAFRDCSNLVSVTIPDSVKTIGKYAFRNCINLKGITIPDSVTDILSWAFLGCESLKSVTIPSSIKLLQCGVFCSCDNLTNVNIPDSMKRIGDFAFSGCTSLTSINIPNSVTEIGACAFNGCSNLTNVTLGDNIKLIEEAAFEDCTALSSITVPKGAKVHREAFFGTDCKVIRKGTPVDNIDNKNKLDDLSWTDFLDELDGDPDWMDSLYQKFSALAYKQVERRGFTDVFTEPSIQGGMGADYFTAEKDGVRYSGSYDYQEEQDAFWRCCYEAGSKKEAIKLCAKKYAEIILNNLSPEDDDDDEYEW